MNEKECIEFYRDLLKAAPWLLKKSDSEIINLLSQVFKTLANRSATREHIRIALAEHRGNTVKRAWDLKKRYIVMLFLRNPLITIKEVHQTISAAFNQRTRVTVISSCMEEAKRISKNGLSQLFIAQVQKEFGQKAKEPNVLLL